MKYTNMQFKIESPEQSKQIQRLLFKLGYEWDEYAEYVKFLSPVILIAHGDGSLSYTKHVMYDYHIFSLDTLIQIVDDTPPSELIDIEELYSYNDLPDMEFSIL